MQRKKSGCRNIPFLKIRLKQIKAIKLLEYNIGKNLSDFGVDNDFLYEISKTQSVKEINGSAGLQYN